MVGIAQRLRRQVVALEIEGSIPSTHPKLLVTGNDVSCAQGAGQNSKTSIQVSYPFLFYFLFLLPSLVPFFNPDILP